VQPGAQVTDSVLGENVDVGPDAVVHKSVVMAGAVVGKGAVIESSIVGPAALVGKGAQVSDLSVLRGSSKIEPGAVLAGARYPSP
jgi:mannose-1-phosphate guanylyltransferase